MENLFVQNVKMRVYRKLILSKVLWRLIWIKLKLTWNNIQLKLFMEEGGKIVTIGSSTQLAYHLKLPVSNAMVEIVNGEERVLGRDKYYTPGSILQMMVDNNDICRHTSATRSPNCRWIVSRLKTRKPSSCSRPKQNWPF